MLGPSAPAFTVFESLVRDGDHTRSTGSLRAMKGSSTPTLRRTCFHPYRHHISAMRISQSDADDRAVLKLRVTLRAAFSSFDRLPIPWVVDSFAAHASWRMCLRHVRVGVSLCDSFCVLFESACMFLNPMFIFIFFAISFPRTSVSVFTHVSPLTSSGCTPLAISTSLFRTLDAGILFQS